MLLQKASFPEEDELVLVNVTKVNPNSVFATLDHYGNRTGLIHISEISPGRIRNIRDFVVEGKKIVCKVLKVDKEKGHIDLSLRRVTEVQKRGFLEAIKQEQKAEKLMTFFADQNKMPKDALNKIVLEIGKEYAHIHDFFADIIENNVKAEDIVSDKNAKKLEEFVKEKIKPEEIIVKGKLKIVFFDSEGVELVKKVLKEIQDNDTTIKYLGAGLYSIAVKTKDIKEGELILKQKVDKVENFVESKKGVFSFEKT